MEFKQAVNEHRYPALFYRFPVLLRGVHLLVLLTTLRAWYVRRALRRLLRARRGAFTYLDAGFGAGDFLLPYARRFASAEFVGLDPGPENVEVCLAYVRRQGLSNVALHNVRVEEFSPAVQADVVACVAVLQYAEDDGRFLARLRDLLKPSGRLLLYVPVNGRRLLDLSGRAAQPTLFDDYEERQGRKRTYAPGDVLDKLDRVGLIPERITYAYGTPGVLYHDLYSALVTRLLGTPPVVTLIFAAVCAVTVYPILLALMLLDYLLPHLTGNGMLVVARRAEPDDRPVPRSS